MKSFMANTIHLRTGGRLVAMMLASLLLLEPAAPLLAQDAPAAAPPHSLQIVILEGEGALNNVQERTAREPIVQVQDENHRPFAGAAVLFAIHGATGGAGAAFAGGASSLSVITDANGVAKGVGLLPNQIQGSWQIHVTASYGNLTTSTTINESNIFKALQNQQESPSPQKPAFKWPLSKPASIVGGVAIGVVLIIVFAELSTNSGTKITTGSGTVGAPTYRPGIRIRF
ncbi:MAG: hypothetical protein ABSF28_05280 [Terracidiphilus sp.]|jgi:hypothetical protein